MNQSLFSKNPKYLVLLDSNALLHRAYHALPPLTSRGQLTNALYGFSAVLIRILNEFRPQYLAACFDLPQPTFRHLVYKEYKAKRVKPPQEFYDQIPLAKEVLSAFKIPIIEKPGYEADDLIGTLALKALEEDKEVEVVIVTGDLDTLQLLRPRIKVWTLKKGIKEVLLMDEAMAKERFGFEPSLLADFKGLKGDPSDNIMGVPSVGDKTAVSLIKTFGSLENLYQSLEEGKVSDNQISPRLKKILLENKDQAFFSKNLALINTNIELEVSLKDLKFTLPPPVQLKPVFDKFSFKSLYERYSKNWSA